MGIVVPRAIHEAPEKKLTGHARLMEATLKAGISWRPIFILATKLVGKQKRVPPSPKQTSCFPLGQNQSAVRVCFLGCCH